MTEAVEQYSRHVTSAESYLRRRDLWDDAVLRGFRLGVVPREGHRPEHRRMVGRLVIPYVTPSGVCNIKFRCIKDHDCSAQGDTHKKYLAATASEDRMFNVQALHDALDTIYVSEGEIDAITATIAGFPTVGISGATKYEDHYTKLFEDFAEVVVLADGDTAGEEFAERVMREVEHARVIYMELDGATDVNEIVAEYGDAALRQVITEGEERE
jgi:5S rRNA maturation endonuclease (ribonuclease M5)